MTMAADARRPAPGPRSCTNADGSPKRLYHARDDARRAARMTRDGTKEYACPTCPFWHVGHPGRKPR